MKKIVHVVGARPNFMKVAPVIDSLERRSRACSRELQQVLVHTGQHYSAEMSDLFFRELGLPEPDINLGVGSGPHGQQTGRIMEAFEQVLMDQQPDCVLVVGDVNSTLACAIDAKKLGIRVVHVEAGLRSRDMTMPEEINRILTDAISDQLFTTEASAADNLVAEGVDATKIHFVGNVMIDSLLKHKDAALRRNVLDAHGLTRGDYVLVTLHRPGNVDDKNALQQILGGLISIASQRRVFWPVHPRTEAQINAFGFESMLEGSQIIRTPPLGYLDFMNATANAGLVMTDSGGIQEETTILGVPCRTLRPNTERPVTISHGTNKLIACDSDTIAREAHDVFASSDGAHPTPELWDGRASERIAEILLPA